MFRYRFLTDGTGTFWRNSLQKTFPLGFCLWNPMATPSQVVIPCLNSREHWAGVSNRGPSFSGILKSVVSSIFWSEIPRKLLGPGVHWSKYPRLRWRILGKSFWSTLLTMPRCLSCWNTNGEKGGLWCQWCLLDCYQDANFQLAVVCLSFINNF